MSNNPYKLNWIPNLDNYEGSIHIKIFSALKEDIKSGFLKAGMKLPQQRLLAWTLGFNPGTIHKAYALAAKQGLISGEIGRGSYVKAFNASTDNWPNENPYSRLIDFSDNFPCLIKDEKILKDSLSALGDTPFLSTLFQYQ